MALAEHIKLRHEKGGSVLFDTLREKVFVANETGGRIAELLSQGTTEEEMVRALCEDFDGDAETIAEDVRQFLHMLEENDLIVREES